MLSFLKKKKRKIVKALKKIKKKVKLHTVTRQDIIAAKL